MPELLMKLLGSPFIETDQKPVEISSRKAIALLVHLAVEGQAKSRDSLATMFWPDQDQSRARAYLRNALWMLTQAGLEPWIEISREAVALRAGYWLDTAEFQDQLTETQKHDHSKEVTCLKCVPLLEKAVSLYRGDFLEGFTLLDCPAFDDWQFFQTDRLQRLYAESLERLVKFYDGEGDWSRAIPLAKYWVALDSLNEAAQRWMMRLFALSGKRSLALKQYAILRETLSKELGIEPDEQSQQLYDEILRQRSTNDSGPATLAASVKLEPPKHNLPAELTSFIGREREILDISTGLRPDAEGSRPVRLLTLTGPGGSGKTRLALKVASELSDDFEDGVYFVNLAQVDHPDMVAATIASTLGVVESPGRPIADTLKDSLKTRKLLLVLDNFEHLIQAAPLVSDLLTAAPTSQVLATSREVLHIYGEQAYPVPPLTVPALDGRDNPGELVQYESVKLFIDRAKAVHPGFEIREQDAGLIAEICARLDGLPLAIELAAARLRLFSLENLHNQISDRLEILRGGPRDVHARQRTLRATIDWSFNLLEEDEQRLFARMSVFQRGFTLESYEHICSLESGLAAMEGLESLIDKSLVIQSNNRDEEPRFEMLERIHAYAREKLVDLGETVQISDRHARFFAQLADEAEKHLIGGQKFASWLQRLESEHGNLRAALDWSLSSGDKLLGMQLAGSLTFFWIRMDHLSEGRNFVERALKLSDRAPKAVQAKLFLSAGILAYIRQDLEACLAAHQKAASLYREIPDPEGLGWALVFYGGTLGMLHPARYPEAVSLCEEGLDILRKIDDKPRFAQALNYMGELARTHGDYEKAKAVYEECLLISRETGDLLRELMMYQNLGFVALREGDCQRAEAMIYQALQLALKINSSSQFADTIMIMAGLLAAQEDAERGAWLMGAGEAMHDLSGHIMQPADKIEIFQYQSNLRELLGDAAYQERVLEGRQMSLDEVLALIHLVPN